MQGNGISRYVAVGFQPTNAPQRVDTPPGAKEFIGEPTVSCDVLPSGRVHFYVVQPVMMRARGIVVNQIFRATVPKHGRAFVKEYPKPIGRTDSVGPGAPWLWPSSREVPEEVAKLLDQAKGDLLVKANSREANIIQNALTKLGVGLGASKMSVPESSAGTLTLS